MSERKTATWGREFASGVTRVEILDELGLVDAPTRARADEITANFDVRVPTAFLDVISAGDEGALHRQFVPSVQELEFRPEELADPIGDETHSPVPFITHRYPDRALLKVTYTCGVYCRFCFRRYKVSAGDENPNAAELRAAIAYLREHEEIREVILTGGDPLALSDRRLGEVLAELNKIPHLNSLRVHTRMPTAVPSRVSDELVTALSGSRLPVWFVLHVNHARELTVAAREAVARLARGGFPLLAQSVLLKGVNDDAEVLKGLMLALVANRITPYYMHYPDLAQGTQHFRIPLARAVEIMAQLRGRVSGFAIPRLVVDIPGGHGKVLLDEVRFEQVSAEEWVFTSPLNGQAVRVRYPS